VKIIGLIGDEGVGKTIASKLLQKKGFYRVDIMAKVKDLARNSFSDQELKDNPKEILNKIRFRGIEKFKSYWINLVLITVPKENDLIVIDDILEEEMNDKFDFVQIYRPGVSKKHINNIKTIENDGDIESFLLKIEALHKSIMS